MLVWSAFHGVKGNWFLSADASGTHTCHSIKNSSELGTSNGVKMAATNVDDNCRGLSSNVNRIQILPMPLPDGATEKNVNSEMIAGFKVEKSVEKTTDLHRDIYLEENCMGTESCAKKKRKMMHAEDACHNPSLKDGCAVFQSSDKDTSIPEIVGCGNSTVDAVKESPGGLIQHEQHGKPTMSDATAEVSCVRNDQFDVEDRLVFEGTSQPRTAEKSNLGRILNSPNLLGSDERKEDNAVESKMDYELGQDVPTEHSGGVSVKVPDLSARLMDASGGLGDVNTDGNKRKKKKVQKTAAKIQDTTDMEQTRKDESMKPCTETHTSEKKEEEKVLSLDHDHEIIIPSNSKASDLVDPDLALKEASFLQDADAVMEPDISSGIKKKKKKKKREKKSADTNLEKSGIEQTDNGITGSSGLLFPSTDHHEGKDVQTRLLESSTLDAGEKVKGVDRDEADILILTQAEQTLEDVGTGNKKMEKKTQSSAGNCHADFPAVDTENLIVEFNQVDKDNENTENKERKATKKRKKRKLAASDVQENLPIKDQKVGIEALATKETSLSFVNSEQEGRHVDSSQGLPHKSEEKFDEMHGVAVNTDDLANTSEKEGEGINFKQYFVPGQYQDKVDSGDKVKKTTKLNQEMKTLKKVKDDDLPSVSISTELQNTIKSFEIKKTENKSRVRKGSGKSKGDSAQNSDWDEMIPNSFRRASGASGKEVKDSSPSEMCKTTLQKPSEILAASSCLNKKNPSLDKPSSERSETFPRKRRNKMSQSGLNKTNIMLVKTPQKKSLFTKPGAIFQDNSGESSGDENGTVHSDGSTLSPSDSSSMSGYSVGESDLSQDSTRNGMFYPMFKFNFA